MFVYILALAHNLALVKRQLLVENLSLVGNLRLDLERRKAQVLEWTLLFE